MFDRFRLGVFDIFGYAIPGLCYLIFLTLSTNFLTLSQLLNKISSLSFYSLMFYFLSAYIIGFSFDGLARRYYIFFSKLLIGEWSNRVLAPFKKANPEVNDKYINEYNFAYIYAYVDVKSPSAREKSDILSALSNMSRNLSLGFFFFAIITLFVSLVDIRNAHWGLVIIKFFLAIFIALFLLYRADRFKLYCNYHLINSYYVLTKDNVKKKEPELKSRRK